MPSLLGTTVTANYNRVVGPSYTVSGDVRTYTGPFSSFGTRILKFYKIESKNGGGGAVDFTKSTLAADPLTSWQDPNSLFARAILALQQFGEVFYVGTPGTGGFIVALADDTASGAEPNSNDQADTFGAITFGAMEAAIKAAVGADTSATVTNVKESADGLSIA